MGGYDCLPMYSQYKTKENGVFNMPNLINYYEELKINRALAVNEINRELSKLEGTWRRRELTNPEKATKMLALILEAREVFQTEATRQKYDQQLDGKKAEKHSKEDQNRLQMEKWKSDAISFFNSKQYDLALITINKAMSFMASLHIEDSSILSLAADIYRHNGDYRTALDYINRAILVDSEDPLNYLIKAAVVGDVGQKRNNLKIAIAIADSNNFLTIKKEILGVYARSLYFENPTDRVHAEQYAREALNLGETWGNAQEVINAIENAIEQKRRQEEQQKADEARKAKEQAEREEAQRKAAEQRQKEQQEKERQEKEIRAINRVLKIISLLIPILIFIFRLQATLGTVHAAEVLCFGGLALIGCFFLWWRFWYY